MSRFFRHIDGGYYRYVSLARHADDQSDVVVYEHLWPFNPGVWVRAAAEFHSRFTEISAEQVDQALKGNREAAQEAVNQAKRERRIREGKA
ncbi:DUF1653 domain-containing protein [Burkholderiaceae bacterium DAT-1]|nr:DUF1653 domain-containing protein [Burkholderiaceae bacterium DAT-1]